MSMTPISGTSGLYPPPPTMRRTPPPMTNTAQLLGISTDELQKDQQSGSTLAQLAAQKGVSTGDLVNSIAADLKANAPQGAPALSDAQVTQMATEIAAGKHPHGHHKVASSSDAGDSSQSNLSSLAAALGVDPSTLVSKLTSGQDLSSLLSQFARSQSDGSASGSSQGSASTVAYGSTGSSSFAALLNGGVAVDQYA